MNKESNVFMGCYDKDTSTLLIGVQKSGTFKVLNMFKGEEAAELYSKLTTRKNGGNV